MADVLLVYPAPQEFKEARFGFSLDLLYIAAILKKDGHRVVSYLDYSIEPFDRVKFAEILEETDVVILEFDSFTLKRSINVRHGEALTRMIKEDRNEDNRGIKVIIYGSDISLFPGKYSHADYTLKKGFELNANGAVEALLEDKPIPKPSVIENLDDLPFPERNLLSSFVEHGGAVDRKANLEKSTLIRTSIGCAGSCTFCQRKAWYKGFQAHSVQYVLKEFSYLKKKEYRNIWITDDNFTCDLKRAKTLLKELHAQRVTGNMKIALSSWALIDEEFLALAKRANVSIISIGVESTNREILRFYKKRIDPARFRQLIRYADSIGLYTVGNFIIGAPMESEKTIEETFSFILDTPFDQVNIKILDYMAGSELYESLPPEKKTAQRHLFASRESGLNDFPLAVLKEKIDRSRKKFKQINSSRQKKKIEKYGLPYYLMGEEEDIAGKRSHRTLI